MKEGDFYRWRYKSTGDRVSPYWCASTIGRVEGGRLIDTYWYSGENHSWGVDDARELLDLEFVANISELMPASPGVHEDHVSRDVVDLSHPNGGRVYLRKGAKRSMAVQLETWRRKRDEAQASANSYQRMIETAEASP